MDENQRRDCQQRLEAGAELLAMLQRCRALAVDAGLAEAVHDALLHSLNVASTYHNSPERLRWQEVLGSLGENGEIHHV